MNEKTILARLKRKWQGQEKDRIIWNEGIVPNFITLDGIYNPISFTCYQLYKILQESFSYQNLYKYLRKYEIEGFYNIFDYTHTANTTDQLKTSLNKIHLDALEYINKHIPLYKS